MRTAGCKLSKRFLGYKYWNANICLYMISAQHDRTPVSERKGRSTQKYRCRQQPENSALLNFRRQLLIQKREFGEIAVCLCVRVVVLVLVLVRVRVLCMSESARIRI